MRCKPNNLQFLEQSQVGKRIVYHDEVPMEEMLESDFFRNVCTGKRSDRLRPSDFLTLIQVHYKNADRLDIEEVIAVRDVVVSKVSKTGEVTFLNVEEKQDTKDEIQSIWVPKSRSYDILKNGEVVADVKEKTLAQDIVSGAAPIPEQ